MGASGTTTITSSNVVFTSAAATTITANDYITFTAGTITWNNSKN